MSVLTRIANINATGRDCFTWTSFDERVDASIKAKLIEIR